MVAVAGVDDQGSLARGNRSKAWGAAVNSGRAQLLEFRNRLSAPCDSRERRSETFRQRAGHNQLRPLDAVPGWRSRPTRAIRRSRRGVASQDPQSLRVVDDEVSTVRPDQAKILRQWRRSAVAGG